MKCIGLMLFSKQTYLSRLQKCKVRMTCTLLEREYQAPVDGEALDNLVQVKAFPVPPLIPSLGVNDMIFVASSLSQADIYLNPTASTSLGHSGDSVVFHVAQHLG